MWPRKTIYVVGPPVDGSTDKNKSARKMCHFDTTVVTNKKPLNMPLHNQVDFFSSHVNTEETHVFMQKKLAECSNLSSTQTNITVKKRSMSRDINTQHPRVIQSKKIKLPIPKEVKKVCSLVQL